MFFLKKKPYIFKTIHFYFNILVIYNQKSLKTNDVALCIISIRQDNSINTYNIIHKNLSSNKTLT